MESRTIYLADRWINTEARANNENADQVRKDLMERWRKRFEKED